MENLFVLALIISVVFFLCKFLEMRFILKEVRPLKELIRESLHVYISSVIGLFIASQFKLLNSDTEIIRGGKGVAVFVDGPNF